MGYSGYSKEQLDEWNMEGGIDINPDMTEIYANDKELQQRIAKRDQYEKNSKKWHTANKKVEFRKTVLKFKGSSSTEKLKKNQVAQGYFDQDTDKAYINNKEVSLEEYLKFQGMTKKDQLINYGEDADKVEIKKDKKGIKDVLTSLDEIEKVNDEEKKLIDESLGKKSEESVERSRNNLERGLPPITRDKPDPKTKVPPIIINHAECGHLTFGDEKDGETERPRDVGLYAGDSNALRLFRDGGFELRSSESAGENKIKGSSIMQVCNNATLLVNSEGDVTIRARNKLRLVADLIEIEAKNASTDGVTIIAEHDIKLRANNNTIITSDNVTIDAKERILSHSEGWQVLIGQYIRLHEPQTKICPAFLKEYIDGQIKTLRN